MPLPEPLFDSRTYRDLLNEALARVPAHNPEWTNLSNSDPGVTLLQLFAFMTESIIYRANLIPERNRMKFLRLLRVPMRPAAPAEGLVTFQNPKGAFQIMTFDRDAELLAGNTTFRTVNGLQVLPVEARLYYKRPLPPVRRAEVEELYSNLYAGIQETEGQFEFYETAVYEPAASGNVLGSLDISRQTTDGALWIALLARQSEQQDLARVRSLIANQVLSLGILPALDEEGAVLYPAGPPKADERPRLLFDIPNAGDERVRYERLQVSTEQDPLAGPAIVSIKLPSADRLTIWEEDPRTAGVGHRPPSLQETDDLDRLITWIRIRSPQIDVNTDASSRQLSICLSWAGINAAKVIQQIRVPAEQLPNGTGEPDQNMKVTNRPVIHGSLRLTVNGETWSEIDDLAAAPPEVPARSPRFASEAGRPTSSATKSPADIGTSKVYVLDRESGEIRFGDGIHGMRPPRGSVIQAAYAYGGGIQGMVGIGSINKGSRLPEGVKVLNPVPSWGASQAETVAEAEKKIPALIRHRDRLVSIEDYKDITERTPGVNLGRVEILPRYHPRLQNHTSDGVVTVLVIPRTDPEHPDAPQPDRLFLETVCAHLAPRRILTTELHVRGPEYQPVWISAGIEVIPGQDDGPVREKVKQEIRRFLSPLEGGFEKKGWPLSKAVDLLEVSAAVARVPGVAKVSQIRLCGSAGDEVDEITIEGHQLPYLRNVVVAEGDAPALDDIRGENEQPDIERGGAPVSIVPVPVVSPECGVA